MFNPYARYLTLWWSSHLHLLVQDKYQNHKTEREHSGAHFLPQRENAKIKVMFA